MDNYFKADLDKFLEKNLNPIKEKFLNIENERYKAFLDNHNKRFYQLSEKHDSFINTLMTLEGGILGAVTIFSNPQQITALLVISMLLILISLIFGILRQVISINSRYSLHQSTYYRETRSHWQIRELWSDNSVKAEIDLIEPYFKEDELTTKKKLISKFLEITKLNADRIEGIFFITIIVALFFLILHLIFKQSLQTNNSSNTEIHFSELMN